MELIRQYMTEFWWVPVLSAGLVVMFFVAIPVLVLRLPADYILSMEELPRQGPKSRPISRILLGLAKNLIGIILIIIGIALLVLPGEGIITIIIGLLLIDFPGKLKFKRWLIQQPVVIRSINWLRAKANQPTFQLPLSSQPAKRPD
jgi:hypothetical protein